MSTQLLTINNRKQVRPSEILDSFRRYLTDKPTPSGFAAMLREIDAGDIAAMCEIAAEIEGKDMLIQPLASQRREAVTQLDWTIESEGDDPLAKEAADYVQDTLKSMDSFPETLEHLQTATGPGIAVTELVWKRGNLYETNDVPSHRLIGDVLNPNKVRILTGAESFDGVPALFGKYAVHTPNCRAGFPLQVTLTRASIMPWIVKHHAIADWVQFAEIFGIPMRWAKHPNAATAPEKTKLESALRDMGPDTYMVTGSDVEIQFLDAAKGTHPGQTLDETMRAGLSILWLGQTLTTEVGDRGALSTASVHENVKASIGRSDIGKERRTIGRQIIRPMVRMRFPGKDVPLPKFMRQIAELRDLDAERLNLEKLKHLREAGLPVDREVEYEMLGVPMPKDAPPPSSD